MFLDNLIVKLYLLIVLQDNMVIIAQIYVFLYVLKIKTILEILVLNYVLIVVQHFLILL